MVHKTHYQLLSFETIYCPIYNQSFKFTQCLLHFPQWYKYKQEGAVKQSHLQCDNINHDVSGYVGAHTEQARDRIRLQLR